MLSYVLIALVSLSSCYVQSAQHTEQELREYLTDSYEEEASKLCNRQVNAAWKYETDLTNDNSEDLIEITLRASKRSKEIYNRWFKDVDLNAIRDEELRRQLKDLKLIGSSALDDDNLTNLTKINAEMVDIYSTAKICPFTKQDCDLASEGLNLEPEIEAIISRSKNYDELSYVWKAWRDQSGRKIRPLYESYVELNNKAAKLNGFQNYGEMWRDSFETPNFVQDIDEIWKQVRPLYAQLHAYARNKLIGVYGKEKIGEDGLIPAHLMGNMWAQSWSNLEDILLPYPNETEVNITKALLDNKYDVLRMFQVSDEFYKSLGLPSNEVCYGPDSMIERPRGKEVLCHASAWDFCDKRNFRIKMCTEVNQEDFITVHHEMGHIQYYLDYKDQPITFRSGANPGFHEAVGDTMALSVQSIKHLKTIDLLNGYEDNERADINTLLSMALEKVAFLPFGLLIDKWRWDVFAGLVPEGEWNKHWWHYREKYQMLKPPFERNETYFDPGAKFHVAGDSQYISYFVSHILQFQFYKELCVVAGQYDPRLKYPPLHKCDFYNSTAAGDKIKHALSLGSSKPWPEVLQIIAGTDKLDAGPLLEYFEPLSEFFKNQDNAAFNTSPTAFNILLTVLLLAFTKMFL